ncbi:3-isopropylmalate dehydratase large subunit 1 [uncultured delta proteobacterium]|uniref:3-isopropylmalate dehydratase large subunit n=1 Tax=uncultured delta proteobacterium TaxID=34034 RepID=A0A212JIW2_9DELT|nr:3-isopropylmalate dehydratase large subunit 1 [uncultured delta proteobacterium]
MSMHAVEKVLAFHAGKASVSTGEIVNCAVDVAGINDLYLQTVRSFFEVGGKKVAVPENVFIFMDHYAPASSIMQADNQKQFREFAREQGIDGVMDIDQGVCHQVVIDHGLSRPGKLVVITDSHTTIHGALGAFGTGVGATDMATILLTGKLWFRVPEVIRINLEGKLRPGVFAKDVILHVIGKLKADYGVYRAVEFTGPALASIPMSERFTLCNMTTEMGAKTAWIQPDAVTFDFLKAKGVSEYTVYDTDKGFAYFAEHNFDLSGLEPQLAAPHSVDNVGSISQFAGKPVQQAYLGTCTGGRLEDLTVAARILAGKHIAKDTRFIVVPASKKVLLDAMKTGVMQTLVEAGATFVTPGCAACLGVHEGMLASGETCISASSRNFPGRMGSGKAEIFLGSPASVAAAALTGKLTDPAPYLA